MNPRAAASLLLLATLACSDSTSPPVDPTMVQEVDLGPPTTVPLLAASTERIYTLRGVDPTSVDVEARRFSGTSRWKKKITSCQEFCFLAVDSQDNVYYTTALDVTSVTGLDGAVRWQAPVRGALIAVGSAGRVY